MLQVFADMAKTICPKSIDTQYNRVHLCLFQGILVRNILIMFGLLHFENSGFLFVLFYLLHPEPSISILVESMLFVSSFYHLSFPPEGICKTWKQPLVPGPIPVCLHEYPPVK